MSNIVEFALKLKDMASGSLRQFGEVAQRTFNTAQNQVSQLGNRNRILGSSFNELQARIREVENTIRTSTIPSHIRAARRELEQLRRQSNNHVGNIGKGAEMAFSNGMVGVLKGGAVIGALYKAGQFLGDSVGQSMERSKIQTSFNVLSGSEESGGALTKQLVDLQKNTILGSEVFKNAQTMMGFGFDSTEVIDNLKMLGDVSMGDAQKLDSLTLAFSQVRAGGKLTGQDLLQFVTAGFNPLEQMSKRTGKTAGQLREEIAKGKISFQDVQQAFKDATSEGGKFNNMLAKIAETPAGKMAQLSGAWNEFKIGVGSALQPVVSFALDIASKVLPVMENLLTPLSEGVSSLVSYFKDVSSETSGWIDYISIIKEFVSEKLVPLFHQIWMSVSSMVKKYTEFISKSEIVKDIFRFIFKVVGFISDVVSELVTSVEWIFNKIIMPVIEAMENVYRLFKGKDKIKLTTNEKGEIKIDRTTEEKKDQDTNNKLLTDIAKNTHSNTASGEGIKESVQKGPKVINVTFHKVFENIIINATSSVEDSINDIASKIEDATLNAIGRTLVQGGQS